MSKINKLLIFISVSGLVLMSIVLRYELNNKPATAAEVQAIVKRLNKKYGSRMSVDFGLTINLDTSDVISLKELHQMEKHLLQTIEEELEKEVVQTDNNNTTDRLANKYSLKK